MLPAASTQRRKDEYKLLNRVIDSLYLRVSCNRLPSLWLQERVKVWRANFDARDENPKETEWIVESIPGLGSFTVRPEKRPYKFVLANPELCDIRIWNPDKWNGAIGGGTGQFYIVFRSRFLQYLGPEAALDYVDRVVGWFCGDDMKVGQRSPAHPEFVRVSRADLAADTQEPRNMKYGDLDWYTSPSRKRDIFTNAFAGLLYQEWQEVRAGKDSKFAYMLEHPLLDNKGGANCIEKIANAVGVEKNAIFNVVLATLLASGADPNPGMVSRIVSSGSRHIETVYFGRFGSELYARRYNKLASLEIQSKEYMREVWKEAGWDEKHPVWRTEFSVSGDFLRHADIEGELLDLRNVSLFLAAVPHLWAYLTQKWLRHCNPSKDRTVSRWETSELWKVIQGAWEAETPATRRKPEPKPNEAQLFQQLKGCGLSALALIGSERFQRAINRETGEVHDAVTAFLSYMAQELESPEAKLEIEKRRQKFGIDPQSDTAFSSLVRSEQMRLELGS